MRRRALLPLLAASAVGVARAQPVAARRLGWLTLNPRGSAVAGIDLVLAGLSARGQLIGSQLALDMRFAEGHAERLPALARELVGLHPTVLVGSGSNAAISALMAATRTIPIVMYGAVSPVAVGLVASLARPGGNVTGTTYNPPIVASKMLELLRGAPAADMPVREPTRFQVLLNRKAARAMGLAVPRELLLLADEVIE